jgi:hypothetical protein
MASRKAHHVYPYSGPSAIARIDQRSRTARFMRRVRADLTAHVGGQPSTTQRLLIERATMLSLRIALFDVRVAEDGDFSEHDGKQYLAWSNSLERCLGRLGLNAADKPYSGPSLSDYLAAKAADRDRAA